MNDQEYPAWSRDWSAPSDFDAPDGHRVGYPGVPAQLRIDTAHTMCDMLDDNVTATFDTPARPWRSAQVPTSRWCKPCSATRRRR